MNDIDHAAEALQALDCADRSGGVNITAYLTRARVHADLALVEVLHEIAHQLRPRDVSIEVDARKIREAAQRADRR